MTYIKLSEKHDAKGFLPLAKSGALIVCLPDNVLRSEPGSRQNTQTQKDPLQEIVRYERAPAGSLTRRKQIREELISVFGAITVSWQLAPYQGTWKYGGVDFKTTSSSLKSSPAPIGKLKGF
jgi:hypothetical protein